MHWTLKVLCFLTEAIQDKPDFLAYLVKNVLTHSKSFHLCPYYSSLSIMLKADTSKFWNRNNCEKKCYLICLMMQIQITMWNFIAECWEYSWNLVALPVWLVHILTVKYICAVWTHIVSLKSAFKLFDLGEKRAEYVMLSVNLSNILFLSFCQVKYRRHKTVCYVK